MASDLVLLGALYATHNITLDDAVILADYCAFVDEIGAPEPESLMSAIDMALDFVRPTPDEDAAITATADAERHEHLEDTCPDCGGEMMDEVDVDQAVELWRAVRMVADKYTFDREYDGGSEIEEC